MGRTRSFEETDVLSAAMHAFRRRGYRALSIRDIELATGLSAGSIYNGFGDKARLFDAAFAHYNRSVLRSRIDRHAPPAAGLDGLRTLFRTLLTEPGSEDFGCLITNSAVEFGGRDGAHPRVEEGLGMLSELFGERIAAARAAGAVPEATDPGAAALRLLALYQGILVLVRAAQDKTALERLIDDEFDSLGLGVAR